MAVQGNKDDKDGQNTQIKEPAPGSNQNIVQEYDQLDTQLDDLNSALDVLEQKNDDIQTKLRQLLKSNIEIRELGTDENAETNQEKK